jgi:hypothetical protein
MTSSKYTLLLLIVSIMIVLFYKLPYEVFSAPSFVRQEIIDGTNDWILATSNKLLEARNISECAEWNPSLKEYTFPSPDIQSVSYISDGKTLNATLWLSDKFAKTPLPIKDSLASSNGEKDIFQERFTILVQKLPSHNVTLNEHINNTLNLYRESLIKNFNLTNFKVIQLNINNTLWNNTAHKILYSAFSEEYNSDLRVMEIWTLNGDKAFLIRYIAEAQKYDLYLPTIQKMIDSLDIGTNSMPRNMNYTSNFLSYKSPALGLKILHPSNWTRVEENNNDNISSISFSSPYEHPPLNDTLSSSPFKNFFSPYEEPSLNDVLSSDKVENFSWVGARYVIAMDINSVYDKGSDYLVQVGWNKALGQNEWVMRFTEQSTTSGIKVLYENKNYTGFYNKDGNYIALSFDLHTLNFPDQYRLVSYVDVYYHKNNRLCSLHDPSNHVPFPPPTFYISTSPNSVTLRPGEEREIQLRLNSTAYSPSNATFSTNQTEDLKVTFTPNRTSVPANGMAVSTLRVKASEEIEDKPYTLPLYATISFPPIVGIKGQDKTFSNSLSERVEENSYLTLTVLPSLTPQEHLEIFYKSWLSPISGIWTFLAGVGAVIAPLIISIYKKRQDKKTKNKAL